MRVRETARIAATSLARFRDAKGRSLVGPAFTAGEESCRECLALRLASCSLATPSFEVATDLSTGVGKVLADHAAFDGGGMKARLFVFPPPPLCRCARAERMRSKSRDLLDSVSPFFGPIRNVEFWPGPEGRTLAVANGISMQGTSGALVFANGSATDLDPEAAARRAVAEALERYSAGFWDENRLVGRGRQSVTGFDCATGDPVLVPAAQVFLPFDGTTSGDSSGLAAGSTLGEATERALAERIERDVAEPFFSEISEASGPSYGHQIMIGREMGHEVWLSVRRAENPPFLAIGLGAHTLREVARAKSDSESLHVAAHMALLAGQRENIPDNDIGWLESAVLRHAFNREAGKHLLSRVASKTSLYESRVLTAPRRRAVVEVTVPDVAAFGLRVVRVITLD